jgi:hypothetical protein
MYARMQVCIKFSAEYRFHETVQRLKSLVAVVRKSLQVLQVLYYLLYFATHTLLRLSTVLNFLVVFYLYSLSF